MELTRLISTNLEALSKLYQLTVYGDEQFDAKDLNVLISLSYQAHEGLIQLQKNKEATERANKKKGE